MYTVFKPTVRSKTMEHIYTIPINEHFAKTGDCPICSLFAMLERNELEAVTGASMMEPSVRIKTNELGFCNDHFNGIIAVGKRLPVALMMQSHLEKIRGDVFGKPAQTQIKHLSALSKECYVCRRLEQQQKNLWSNIFWLWTNDSGFRDKVKSQTKYCLPHYEKILEYGSRELNRKSFAEFARTVDSTEEKYIETLQQDIDWFCKKFDYRFAKEDWKNSRDAIERTVWTLTGKAPQMKSE